MISVSSREDQDVAEVLRTILGDANVRRDDSVSAAHAGDWSGMPKVEPPLVLFPKTPAQVGAALAALSNAGRKLVIQGGLTGLAGGATPQQGEIALSLAKLDAIEAFDPVGGTVTVQAGVTLERLQAHVEAEGWFFPLDLGARGSCQVGGNAATNAGGNRVLRYGTMRDLVLGLEVALPNGTLLTMLNQVVKNTTGVDLKHLFIGSEGTLGVITRLVLKLSRRPSVVNTALCAFSSFAAVTRLFNELRPSCPSLSAFELMWADYMETAVELGGLRQPFAKPWPIYVLIETMGADPDAERHALETCLERALESELVNDVVVAQSLEHAKQLWQYREAIGEMLMHLAPHAAFDVGVPISSMESFVSTVRGALGLGFPHQRHLFFGHIGDGNLHVLSGPYQDDKAVHEVEDLVYRAVRDVGGCISAEHGIGMVKKEFLPLSRSADEMCVMRSLKDLFDPGQLLNAGRILSSH